MCRFFVTVVYLIYLYSDIQIMAMKSLVVHEKAGKITLIELDNLENKLPVSTDTYLRILYGLTLSGYIKLPVKAEKESLRSSRQ